MQRALVSSKYKLFKMKKEKAVVSWKLRFDKRIEITADEAALQFFS